MASTSNSTLKGVLAFGALTIGAVMFFVGSAEDEGVLSEAAGTYTSDTDGNQPASSGNKAAPKPGIQDHANVVEWDDEALVDNTNGTDPSPESTDPFSDRPTDDTINDADVDPGYIDADDAGPPEVGGLVPIPSNADLR